MVAPRDTDRNTKQTKQGDLIVDFNLSRLQKFLLKEFKFLSSAVQC